MTVNSVLYRAEDGVSMLLASTSDFSTEPSTFPAQGLQVFAAEELFAFSVQGFFAQGLSITVDEPVTFLR